MAILPPPTTPKPDLRPPAMVTSPRKVWAMLDSPDRVEVCRFEDIRGLSWNRADHKVIVKLEELSITLDLLRQDHAEAFVSEFCKVLKQGADMLEARWQRSTGSP